MKNSIQQFYQGFLLKFAPMGRYPVIPLLGISVRKAMAFPSLLPLCRKIPRRVYMRQRVAALSNGANLAPQLISMLLAVFPVATCQGDIHHFSSLFLDFLGFPML